MDINQLAKYMRERALLIEGSEEFDEQSLRDFSQIRHEKEKKLRRVEELKKLYFNAGRFVGGARDYTARLAYQQMKDYEARHDK